VEFGYQLRMPSSGIQNPSSYLTGNTSRLCYRTQLVNATKIWDFHGGDYGECCLLECVAIWLF
jgi:hypothetical protein